MSDSILNKEQIIKKIIIQASKNNIEEIKKILPSLKRENSVNKIIENLYEILPEPIKIDTPKILINITVGDLSERIIRTEQIYDFDKSIEFYKKVEKTKNINIISDEFSNERNTNLYKGFNLIEEKWRKSIIMKSGLDKITQANPPKNIRSGYDHKISQYDLGELLENFLYQPASDEYILKKWKESNKNEDEIIILRKLTKVDEFNFPLNTHELKFLQKIRNKCMHFRVISPKEYSESVEKINKYLKTEELNNFVEKLVNSQSFIVAQKVISLMVEQIKPTMEAAIKINSEYIKAVNALYSVFS